MSKLFCVITIFLFLAGCQEKPAEKKAADSSHNHHGGSPTTMGAGKADYADSVNRGLIGKDTLKGSPLRMTMANIGRAHVHIEYSSPGVKDRVVWGGLVPYGQVWVSGAHSATSVSFSTDVVVMGKPIKAGTYAFFTIPGKETWTIILNTRFDQHLTDDYNEKEDVARFAVKPQIPDVPVQRLTYAVVADTDSSGGIHFSWERVQVVLPLVAQSR